MSRAFALSMVAVLISGMFFSAADAASIALDPATGKYGPGDTFMLTIRLDNQGECINAAQVTVSYPTASLRAVDFGRGGSIFSLWPVEPTIDDAKGTVTFAGGVPGGYCGKVQGDPGESNVLGKIAFTVTKADAPSATVHIDPSSLAYLNDGLGTKAKLTTKDAHITLAHTPVGSSDAWVKEVQQDSVPPDPFAVEVESTRDVFGGLYYIVFSTVDKQSGLDHYEIFEDGAWKRVSSPYKVPDQSLKADIRVKAIDKAGNERIATYSAVIPPSQSPYGRFKTAFVSVLVILGIAAACALLYVYLRRRYAMAPSAAHEQE